MEYADVCVQCQNRHLNDVKKPDWKVICSGIPKSLWEKGYFPLDEIIEPEEYFDLSEDELISLHYKYNRNTCQKLALNMSNYRYSATFGTQFLLRLY